MGRIMDWKLLGEQGAAKARAPPAPSPPAPGQNRDIPSAPAAPAPNP